MKPPPVLRMPRTIRRGRTAGRRPAISHAAVHAEIGSAETAAMAAIEASDRSIDPSSSPTAEHRHERFSDEP